jgi:YD repeat-containing protein
MSSGTWAGRLKDSLHPLTTSYLSSTRYRLLCCSPIGSLALRSIPSSRSGFASRKSWKTCDQRCVGQEEIPEPAYSYEAAGRWTQVGSATLSYDQAGDLTQIGADSFSWNWAGELTSASVGGTNSSYTYDGEGLRVASQSGSSSTTNLWDRASSLPTLLGDGSQGYLSSGGLLEQTGSGTTSYPLADGLGSERSIADQAGSIVGSAGYDVFGAVRASSGSQSTFGFGGEQTDPTGLTFLRARY